MRIALLFPLGLLACSVEKVPETFNAQAKAQEQAAKERALDGKAVRAGFAPDQPAPLETVSVDPPKTSAPGIALPAADLQYRYIGRWAATAALCQSNVWRFRTRDLDVAGKTKCALPEVSTVPSGYELGGTCRTVGKPLPDTLKLSFNERQHTMRVVAQRLGPIELIYCGD